MFIAGRGARGQAAELERLADACGALLATSAVAKGLFGGSPWNLDVSGSFASPLAAELISGADVIVGFGCSLNMWTMRHGKLIGPDATVVQVDDDASAIGAHRPVRLGVLGDVAETARAVHHVLAGGDPDDRIEAPTPVRDQDDGGTPGAAGTPGTAGYRSARLRDRIAREVRWRDVAYADDGSDGQHIDPRTLSIALDDMLPAERTVAVDSGNFMGYPSMYLSVPDEAGFCFTQAFQSIGLGLASAIGAAIARPDRLAVAALGDGGALMGVSELETVVRLGLPMVVVVYDDEAYGAEVHHFGPDGDPLDIVRFPPADIAAIGRGFGFEGRHRAPGRRPPGGPRLARRAARAPAAHRREGHVRARRLVAGGSLPRPLTRVWGDGPPPRGVWGDGSPQERGGLGGSSPRPHSRRAPGHLGGCPDARPAYAAAARSAGLELSQARRLPSSRWSPAPAPARSVSSP